MKKIIYFFVLIILTTGCDNIENSDPNVKKSISGICHKKGSQYYKQTKKYEAFVTIADCLDSGGRLPR